MDGGDLDTFVQHNIVELRESDRRDIQTFLALAVFALAGELFGSGQHSARNMAACPAELPATDNRNVLFVVENCFDGCAGIVDSS